MNQWQKQIYLTPVLFSTFFLCIFVSWMVYPILQWFDINAVSVYVHSIACALVSAPWLMYRIRLVINADDNSFHQGNSPTQKIALTFLILSIVSPALVAGLWINQIGKSVNITDISQLKQEPRSLYIALSPEVLAQLQPAPAQPVEYNTTKYEYYCAFAPFDSAFNFVWLPCISYSQFSPYSNIEQVWRDTLKSTYTAQQTQYFRDIGADADKNKYYGMSLNMPSSRPVFFEKIEGTAEQENARSIINLLLLSVGCLLFYALFSWVLPLDSSYAALLLKNKVPWWNPLIDKKMLPWRQPIES